MDCRVAYANDLLKQAEQCFTDKELSYSFLKFIKTNSTNKQEAERKLKALKARICYLEDKAKFSYKEILDLEKSAKQEEQEFYDKQNIIFKNNEIYDFFMDEKNNEFIKYLKDTASLERINIAIKRFENLRVQSDKLINDLKKCYQKTMYPKIITITKTKVELKKSTTLQLDRGFYLNNIGRF